MEPSSEEPVMDGDFGLRFPNLKRLLGFFPTGGVSPAAWLMLAASETKLTTELLGYGEGCLLMYEYGVSGVVGMESGDRVV
jgi:hypothetical protein